MLPSGTPPSARGPARRRTDGDTHARAAEKAARPAKSQPATGVAGSAHRDRSHASRGHPLARATGDARPSPWRPPPRRAAGRRTHPRPHLPKGGVGTVDGRASPYRARLPLPTPLRDVHGHGGGPRRGVGVVAGNGERHRRLGFGHLKGDLERSRGTTESQATRALARRGGAEPTPGAGWGPPAGHSPEARRSVRCVGRPRLRQPHVRGSGTKSGRVPHPCSSTPRRRAGRRGEGPRGQSEKSGPIQQECPSLVWRGLGPAQESATSPHRSIRTAGRASG